MPEAAPKTTAKPLRNRSAMRWGKKSFPGNSDREDQEAELADCHSAVHVAGAAESHHRHSGEGFSLMPVRIAGREISTINPLIVSISTAGIVVLRTIRR